MRETELALACPTCCRDDKIQKASAIYAAGTTHGVSTNQMRGAAIGLNGGVAIGGGTTRSFKQSQTILGRRLSPPARPTREKRYYTLCGFGVVGFGVAGGAAVDGSMDTGQTILGQQLLVVCAVCLILAIYLYVQSSMVFRRDCAEYEEGIADWREAYYCHRCDETFIPEG